MFFITQKTTCAHNRAVIRRFSCWAYNVMPVCEPTKRVKAPPAPQRNTVLLAEVNLFSKLHFSHYEVCTSAQLIGFAIQ